MRGLTDNEDRAMFIISQNFLNASEIVGTTRRSWNETADALIKHDLDNAIVLAECALESLKGIAEKFKD